MIEEGQKVTIRYKIFAEDGSEAASNYADKNGQAFFIGRGQMLPAFETEVMTMKIGEKRSFKINKEDGFGEVIPELLKTGSINKIPETQRKIGNILDLEDPQGRIISARIHALSEHHVTLDFNHPLAGQVVTFEVEVLAIE